MFAKSLSAQRFFCPKNSPDFSDGSANTFFKKPAIPASSTLVYERCFRQSFPKSYLRLYLKNAARYNSDRYFMQQALTQAKHGQSLGEVPVGAVLVWQDKVIAADFNRPISQHDPSAHAEMLVLRQACQQLGNYRLPVGMVLYVTLEPCMMCFGALVHARLGRVVFGAYESKSGAALSYPCWQQKQLNHRPQITGGVLQQECSQLLQNFFCQKRQQRRLAKLHRQPV